jgi:biopolymer transport protein TolR
MRKRRFDSVAEINVTNLVDVMLVLLIIFMITAPMMRSGIPVNLPRADAQSVGSRESIVVTVAERGLFVDGRACAESELVRAVKIKRNGRSGIPVMLEADQGIPYGRVVNVMDMIKRAGVDDLNLVVEPGETR